MSERDRSRRPIPCPVCTHDETMRARLDEREACYDDSPRMRWSPPPGGYRGQEVSRWDRGAWTCEACDLALTPRDAYVLLDAALMHAYPDCDSIVDGVHLDAQVAAACGRDRP